MTRPVQYSAHFIDALHANLKYLRGRGDSEWGELLDADLFEVERLVSTFSTAGKRMASRASVELRKLRLQRTPFVVWYVVDVKKKDAPVTFLRLFHVRQRSVRPRF